MMLGVMMLGVMMLGRAFGRRGQSDRGRLNLGPSAYQIVSAQVLRNPTPLLLLHPMGCHPTIHRNSGAGRQSARGRQSLSLARSSRTLAMSFWRWESRPSDVAAK